MLLYLGSSDNNSILELLNERKIIVKKQLGELDLKKFIIHDMKNLDHYSYVVVDLEAVNNYEDEIIEAIMAFKMLYNPRLIILAKEISNQFLYRIVNEVDLQDIIFSKDEEIIESFKMCLDYQEEFRRKVREYVKKLNLKYSFPHEDVKILIGGIGSIFGTTKVAINLATYLSEVGTKVAYTEAFTTEGYVEKIANHYKFKDNYMDIDFFYNGDIPLGYDFNVIDIGVLNEKSLKIFNSKDFGEVRIVCSSVKQHELEDLIKVLEENNQVQVDVILTYSSDKEKNFARKLLKNKGNIHFINNSISLFDATNSSVFREVLSKYIVENK